MPREFIALIGMGLVAGLPLSLLRAGGLITFLAMWVTFIAMLVRDDERAAFSCD